jgi:type II secretory pathway component PulJ
MWCRGHSSDGFILLDAAVALMVCALCAVVFLRLGADRAATDARLEAALARRETLEQSRRLEEEAFYRRR